MIRDRASGEKEKRNEYSRHARHCEPGHLTASAAFDVAETEGSAGLDDCGETDDDAAADKDSSIFFACAGAAAIRAGENGGVRRSGLKTLNHEKLSKALVLG